MNPSEKIVADKYHTIVEALKSGQYAEAERQAITELKSAPRAAQCWVLLGEALLHQGFRPTAAKVFERAWLLDPEASWVGAVQQALNKGKGNAIQEQVEDMLRVKPVTVTGAVLVKNEERTIEKCLRALVEAVDEILVVDTGSTDRTVEIAKTVPKVRVIHREWNEDFAAARNEGLKEIRTDWVLWVDGDEILFPEDAEHVRTTAALFDDAPVTPILQIWQHNYIRGKVAHDLSNSRMFPLRRGLKYWGKIHEQIGDGEKGIYGRETMKAAVRLRVHHDGYDPEVVKAKDKLQRNLNLLNQMIEEDPNNPGWWLFYGRETLSSGDQDKALDILLKARDLGEQQPRFGRMLDIHMYLAKIYLSRKQFDEAEQYCNKALAIQPNFPDASYYLAHIAMTRAVEQAKSAERHLKKAKVDFSSYRGSVSPDHQIREWKSDLLMADIARMAGKLPEAKALYMQVLKRNPELTEIKKKLDRLEEIRTKL